jgi:hypothetical protein
MRERLGEAEAEARRPRSDELWEMVASCLELLWQSGVAAFLWILYQIFLSW